MGVWACSHTAKGPKHENTKYTKTRKRFSFQTHEIRRHVVHVGVIPLQQHVHVRAQPVGDDDARLIAAAQEGLEAPVAGT
jgi:hypothetical protein